MKRFLPALMILLFAATLSSAEVFKITNIKYGTTKIKATEKSSGTYLWHSQTKDSKINYKGQVMVYSEETGGGTYDKKDQTWITKSFFTLDGTKMTPYQITIVFKDKDGAVTQTVDKYYDQQKKKIIGIVKDGSDKVKKSKEFDFKDDIVDTENLGTCLRNFPFEEKRDVYFNLLTDEPTLYGINMKYLGIENLQVNGKEVPCYRLQMVVDLGALGIIGAFIPKTYFWYEVKPPHEFVRYEGLESGLGTPYIVREIVAD